MNNIHLQMSIPKFTPIYKKIQENTISEHLQIFPIFDGEKGEGGKIILPERLLKALMDRGYSLASSSPLYFKISAENGSVYASLLEFNSNPDEANLVQVPHFLIEQLRVEVLDPVLVENITLKTASYLKIQPIQREFYMLPDYRSLLEEHLSRNYLVLQLGQHISLNYVGEIYDILVVELKVGEETVEVANIHETDLVLDLVEMPKEVEPEILLPEVKNNCNLLQIGNLPGELLSSFFPEYSYTLFLVRLICAVILKSHSRLIATMSPTKIDKMIDIREKTNLVKGQLMLVIVN